MKLTFFTKADCPLCSAAWFVVHREASRFNLPLLRVDITAPGNERWFDLYKHHIPVVRLDDEELFWGHVDERRLRTAILERRAAGG